MRINDRSESARPSTCKTIVLWWLVNDEERAGLVVSHARSGADIDCGGFPCLPMLCGWPQHRSVVAPGLSSIRADLAFGSVVAWANPVRGANSLKYEFRRHG